MPLGVSVPVSLIVGAGVGLFNGVLVYNFGITPFIATLGTTMFLIWMALFAIIWLVVRYSLQ